MKGQFITFEGGEGAGKSTLIKALAARFAKQEVPVLVTREPGAGELGAKIRALLLEGSAMPARSELFLFLADRAAHVDTILRPALAEGKVVLCDRHADSTLVYQAAARDLDPDFVRAANEFAVAGLTPDLTILLDIDPELGLRRVSEPNRLDQESLEFHQRVRRGFLDLAAANPSRIRGIDASQSPGAVLEEVWSLVRRS